MSIYNKVTICDTTFDEILSSQIYNDTLHVIYRYEYEDNVHAVYISMDLSTYAINKYIMFTDCSHGYIIDDNIYMFSYNDCVYKTSVNDDVVLYNE